MRNTLIALLLVLLCSVAYAGTISANGMSQSDTVQLLAELVYTNNNRCFTKGGLAVDAGAKAKFKTVATSTVVCSGAFIADVTASSGLVFTAPVATIPANYSGIFAVGIDSTGAFKTKQSQSVRHAAQLVTPLFADGIATIGTIKVVCSSTGGFVPNSTALDVATNTVTFSNAPAPKVSLTVNKR